MALIKSTLSEKSAKQPIGGANNLKEFFKGLKEKKEQRKTAAKRNISNNNAANEAKILAVLDDIDFSQSKLDPELLELRTLSSQLYGDLEQTRNDVKDKIISNTNYSNLKLKEFDKRIYEIALEFKNAISNGHKNAAFAARSALYIAVIQIRNQLPFIRQEWQQNYLDSCTEYLDKWIQLIEECISLDASNNSLEQSEIQLQSKLADSDLQLKTFQEDLEKDQNLLRQIIAIKDLPVEQAMRDSTIGPMVKKLFNDLLDREIESKIIKFDIQMNKMQRHRQIMYASQVDMLRRNIENKPIPNDPLSFQKFKGDIDEMFKEMIKVDNEYQAFMKLMIDIEGRVDQLSNSQASKMENKMVQDQIRKLIESENNIESETEGMTVRELREKLGMKEKEVHAEENTDMDVEIEEEENLN